MKRRRKTRRVRIGGVEVGGNAPVSIQSMVKTDITRVETALNEIRKLAKTGCDIVRVAVKDLDSVSALKRLVDRSRIPIVADIHFLPKLAIGAIEAGAAAIRLNPGNIRRRSDLAAIIKRAKERKIPIRIGVNSGSLVDRRGKVADAMVRSALDYIKFFESVGYGDIIISLKSSDVAETVDAYRKMSVLCDYPFHLGVTAAGPLLSATVKSSVGIGTLLEEGLGDTIRVSLTGDSVKEVLIGKEILSALKLRMFGPEIVSCPTCGRCDIDLIGIVEDFKDRLKEEGLDRRSRHLKVAIMGCVVNGPGEAREADVGIAGGADKGILFRKGKKIRSLRQSEFVEVLLQEVRSLQ